MKVRELHQEIQDANEVYGGGTAVEIPLDATHRLNLYRMDKMDERQDKMEQTLADLSERVIHIEKDMRLMRWIFGGITVLAAKEILGWLIKDVIPSEALHDIAFTLINFIG